MRVLSRVATGSLIVGGLFLLGLMGYTLSLNGDSTRTEGWFDRSGAARIAVFLPERPDWVDVRRGLSACVARGLAREVTSGPDVVVLETPGSGRRLRLERQHFGGVADTREEITRLLSSGTPPVAVIGSNNTVRTVALADALQSASALGTKPGPVLLVPWATTDQVRRADGVSTPLLELYPGRTFRFCPNNQREAELLVRCLLHHDEFPPALALLIVDPGDPYSGDLSRAFSKAIAAQAPEVEVQTRRDRLSAPGPGAGMLEQPGPVELERAEEVWRLVRAAPEDRNVWVILPLQGRPTRRMLHALRERAWMAGSPETITRLRVLCGDGIGLDSLAPFVGACEFPIWCVAPSSIPAFPPDQDAEALGSAQIYAEIASALLNILDRMPEDSNALDLADALRALDLPADSPNTFGRSLSFNPDGERQGNDLGHVFTLSPEHPGIRAYRLDTEGHWSLPVPVVIPALARR